MRFPKNCIHFFSEDNNLFYWYDTDTKALFYKQQRKFPNFSKLWDNVPITYTLNSYGFRTNFSLANPPDKETKRILVLGCSFTFGTGLLNEQIWCNIVEKNTEKHVINLASPGGSFDSIFRILYAWYKIVQPDQIVIQTPHPTRREFFSDDLHILTAGSWRSKFLQFREKFWSDTYDEFYNFKNRMLINTIAESASIQYIDIESFRVKDDYARDGLHYGPRTHERFAEYIIENVI